MPFVISSPVIDTPIWDTGEWPKQSRNVYRDRPCRDFRRGFDAPVTHRWAGHVGYTPDWVQTYEELKPGVWAVDGQSGRGNVLGSAYARAAVRSAGRQEQLL